ncbi:dienelactone hydrolase family protein [Streptomyces microflavus]|uniref:alpha/beta hydrolase family protein n=1 Tax=Streptomyces microflavus TaxID=1919 RepID=UPI003802CD4E
MHVIAASFSGGAAALHAAHRPDDVAKLVLLNPRLDYKERYTTSRPGWSDDYLSREMALRLDEHGFTEKSPFELNRALLNEVFYLDTPAILARVRAPVLMVHGTADTFVPVESSRRHRPMFGGPVELVEFDGAQHGFAVHDDPQYRHPQTQAWQREVIGRSAPS